uniref:Protein kinase domain-containing protein n=1 Tax=Rhabditophanes sp. KR3021 TaxID=114890 RepID=A0AC35UDY0_9BILA
MSVKRPCADFLGTGPSPAKNQNLGPPPEVAAIMNIIKYNGVTYNNVTRQDFKLLDTLGSGAFGTVVKVNFNRVAVETGLFAIKEITITMNAEERKKAYMDCKVILKTHTHKNIVNCYGIVSDECYIYICMEVMQTCLSKFIKAYFPKNGIEEKYVIIILVEVLSGLMFLKECGYMHRDIKPSNILLNWDGMVKLCDFGIAGSLFDSQIIGSDTRGEYGYLAPERIKENGSSYTVKSDVWSFGVTIYEAMTSVNPFVTEESTVFELYAKIVEGNVDLNKMKGTPNMVNFVQNCLEKIVDNRADYNQLFETALVQNAIKPERSRFYQAELTDWISKFFSEY